MTEPEPELARDLPGREPGEGEPREPRPERQSTPFLVLQFFIFPMAIVAISVGVFLIFGLIAAEGKSARDYVQEIRSGGANRRWQAAFELSKLIQSRNDKALQDPRFASELVSVFEDSEKDDPRVRRYLALALGKVGDTRAVKALLKVVSGTGAEADSETLIYSIWALGAIRDDRALPELLRLSEADDAGVRKAAVYALGSLPGEASSNRLREALQDQVQDVRWNAALALARRGDRAASAVLLAMLDRTRLGSTPNLTAEQAEEAMLEAVAAAAFLPDPEIETALEGLRDHDPSLRVRDAARAALSAPTSRASAP